MTSISKEQVRHVANLARLEMNDEHAEKLTKELDEIIHFADLLNEVDIEGVEPTSHVLPIQNVLREDTAEKGLPQEEVLKNAPDHKDGQIRVPSIME